MWANVSSRREAAFAVVVGAALFVLVFALAATGLAGALALLPLVAIPLVAGLIAGGGRVAARWALESARRLLGRDRVFGMRFRNRPPSVSGSLARRLVARALGYGRERILSARPLFRRARHS